MDEKYFTVREVADIFRQAPDTVRKKFREGTWPASKLGKSYLASDSDIAQIKKIIRPTAAKQAVKRRGLARI